VESFFNDVASIFGGGGGRTRDSNPLRNIPYQNTVQSAPNMLSNFDTRNYSMQSGGGNSVEGHGYTFNNEAFAYAAVATTGLLADDSTVIGVYDDLLIPNVWVGAEMVWLYDNRAIIKSGITELAQTVSGAFDPGGFKYVTYTKTSTDGLVYVGRTSGYGNPEQIVRNRDASHHIKGYGAAVLSSSVPATISGGYGKRLLDTSYWAIRGSEQIQIEHYRKLGISGNARNGISPTNEELVKYIDWG
jgi:hypothetical protein